MIEQSCYRRSIDKLQIFGERISPALNIEKVNPDGPFRKQGENVSSRTTNGHNERSNEYAQ